VNALAFCRQVKSEWNGHLEPSHLIGGGTVGGPQGWLAESDTGGPFVGGGGWVGSTVGAAANKEGVATGFGYLAGSATGGKVVHYSPITRSSLPDCVRSDGVGVRQIAYAPGADDVLAVVYTDGKILMYQASTGQLLPNNRGELPGGVPSLLPVVALSPLGNVIAIACGDRVRFWDWPRHRDDRDELVTLVPAADRLTPVVTVLEFSPKGNHLAIADDGGRVSLRAAEGPSKAREFVGHDAGVRAMAFSPDGKWLATGSADKTARLWDVADLT